MDNLQRMMNLQKVVNSHHEWIKNTPDREKRINVHIEALQDEAAELKREFNWKQWKKIKKPWNTQNIKSEIIDIFVFLICICMELEISPSEIWKRYKEIAERNIKRQQEEY